MPLWKSHVVMTLCLVKHRYTIIFNNSSNSNKAHARACVCVAPSGSMIVNSELEMRWKECLWSELEVLPRNLIGGIEENHENFQPGCPAILPRRQRVVDFLLFILINCICSEWTQLRSPHLTTIVYRVAYQNFTVWAYMCVCVCVWAATCLGVCSVLDCTLPNSVLPLLL